MMLFPREENGEEQNSFPVSHTPLLSAAFITTSHRIAALSALIQQAHGPLGFSVIKHMGYVKNALGLILK